MGTLNQQGKVQKSNGRLGFIRVGGTAEEVILLPGSCAAFGGRIPPVGTAVKFRLVTNEETGRPRAEDVEPADPDQGTRNKDTRSSRNRRWGCHETKEQIQDIPTPMPDDSPTMRNPPTADADLQVSLRPAGPARLPPSLTHASTLNLEDYVTSPQDAGPMIAEHGFAILHGVLSDETCARVLSRCESILQEMLAMDKERLGNRGLGRYSMGAASQSGQQLHHAEWALLLVDPVLDALDSIYGPGQYFLRGGGGEIVLGGVRGYQDLHADISTQNRLCDTQARPPLIVVNFAIHDIPEDHGPTRIWPARGRPRDRERPPAQDAEPSSVFRSTLAPLPQGSCVVRDARIWHGGTPNYKANPRFLPNLEFFSREHMLHMRSEGKAKAGKGKGKGRLFQFETMTQEVFQLLPPRSRVLAQGIVATGGISPGIKPNFARAQGEAFDRRVEAQLAALRRGGTASVPGSIQECMRVKEMSRAQGFSCIIERQGKQHVAWVTQEREAG